MKDLPVPQRWSRAERIADARERSAIREHDGGLSREEADRVTAAEYRLLSVELSPPQDGPKP